MTAEVQHTGCLPARETGKIVKEGHGCQCHDQRNANPTASLLDLCRQGSASDQFPQIIHKVSPIEHGDRQKIQYSDTDADQGEKSDKCLQAVVGGLTSRIGDGHRPTNLTPRELSQQHSPQRPKRQQTHLPGPIDPLGQGLPGII